MGSVWLWVVIALVAAAAILAFVLLIGVLAERERRDMAGHEYYDGPEFPPPPPRPPPPRRPDDDPPAE
ncbi:MAG TPA: hypothetical protein VGI67_06020 [Thermoleophilaceae bacterium]